MPTPSQWTYPLHSLSELEPLHLTTDLVTYRGRRAVRLVEENGEPTDDHPLALIVGSDFQNGVIRTEIAGARRPDAPPDMRGFVGIAFRIRPSASHFECFFLRPDNGRAEDQLRRNHSTQYVSHPDYPWDRLRAENPGVYESYADLESGAWTSVKIVVSGVKAALFVNNAEQPCLIVNDLKLGESRGQIGLWIGAGTEAHFTEVVVEGIDS